MARPVRALLYGSALCISLSSLCGCSLTSSPASAVDIESAEMTKRAWKAPQTLPPIGFLDLVPGEVVTVPTIWAWANQTSEAPGLVSVSVHGLEGVSVTPSADSAFLNIEIGNKTNGVGEVRFGASSGDESYSIPLLVKAYEPAVFRYTEDPSASRVFVAGDFNGWSNSANELAKQDDGSFLLKLPVGPGTWNYKFVVDGNWIADPSNPHQDTSGYGNSVLEVGGEVESTLQTMAVSAATPLEKPGFLVQLEDNERLDLEKTVISINNVATDLSDLEIDPSKGTILVPDDIDGWGAENYIALAAATTTGRKTVTGAHFHGANVTRSPRDEVIYYAFTDRFADSDPSLNRPVDHPELVPLTNYHGGDWKGIEDKISEGYFEDLGVTTLWLAPANNNTMEAQRDAIPPHRMFSSYHGYWPTSDTEVNPQFGSWDDLKSLVSTAHDNEMAILLDYVANHVHEDHPLFAEYPESVTQLDLPDGRQNIRLFDEYPLTTWFDNFLPTLEYRANPELVDKMTENAVWWLNESGADGFRFDAVKHVPNIFWTELDKRLDEEFGKARGEMIYSVGETISDRNTINKFIGPNQINGQFDFPLLFTMQGVLGREQGSMEDLANDILASQDEYPPYAIMSPLIGNHDVVRFMAIAEGDLPDGADWKELGFTNPPTVDDPVSYKKIELALAVLMALPGPPTLYYGDEIGMTGAHDPDNRRPMIWDDLLPEQLAVREALSEMTATRHQENALRRGHLEVLSAGSEHLVVARVSVEDVLVGIFSRRNSSAAQSVILPPALQSVKSMTPLAESSGSAPSVSLTEAGFDFSAADHSWGYYRLAW